MKVISYWPQVKPFPNMNKGLFDGMTAWGLLTLRFQLKSGQESIPDHCDQD
jgi:hypothetical protein